LIAARQAVHVVGSVKTLGARTAPRNESVELNESLRETLALMSNTLGGITVRLDLVAAPKISANRAN
jgi:hypothetical protein